jgi:hypothetical protein
MFKNNKNTARSRRFIKAVFPGLRYKKKRQLTLSNKITAACIVEGGAPLGTEYVGLTVCSWERERI